MSETIHIEEQKTKEPQTPFDLLALFPDAPTPAQIDIYRQQVPGARLRLLPMKDGRRLFLLRGFTAIELQRVQQEATKVAPEKQLYQLQVLMASMCTLWTSISKSGRLTEVELNSSGAGLAATLYHAIMDLSDYNDPEVLEQLFVDF